MHRDNNIYTPYNFEGVDVFGSKVGALADTYRWADCVMTHLDFTQFTILQAAQAKRPLVHFIHNDISYESIKNNIGNQAAVYNSEWTKDVLRYPIPGYVLHPPCDARDYRVESTREYITLISLNERKGGYMFYQIARAMPERKFLGVIGSYDNSGALKLSQGEIVELLGSLPNVTVVQNSPDILSTYRRTRLLLMPSDYESWGRTATEAMCSGIPVICTPTRGLKENCGSAAVYVGVPIDGAPGEAQVDTGTVAQWIRAIRDLDDPDEYRKYSLLSQSRAEELNPVKELEGLERFLLNIAKQ